MMRCCSKLTLSRASFASRAIHQIRPRLDAERQQDVRKLFESRDKSSQFRLAGTAGTVQVLFWANVAGLWGRNMRDSVGALAPLWQRGLAVSVCTLVAASFAFLAFAVSRHHVAWLEYIERKNEVRFATYKMFGGVRTHEPVRCDQVTLVPNAAAPHFVSFRAPRAPTQPLRLWDLPLRIDLRGKLFVERESLLDVLSNKNPPL
jgi:hypothetical protein